MLAFLLVSALASPPDAVFAGREGQVRLEPPRLEETVEVDGQLTEAAWERAAHLTAFSLYAPVDGSAADEETEVLLFYSPTALHLGVRARAAPGSVRATLAQRDRLATEDVVQVFLSTYNDVRQAQYFAANPLGVQADGILVEGTSSGRTGFFASLDSGREEPDLSPDYLFDSKGTVEPDGYVLEMRIPFKSLRFPGAETQSWRLHVTRRRQAVGREDSWVPARRAAASFLAQAGTLSGLHGLRRGLVLDLTPETTAAIDGADAQDGWSYDARRPQAGVTLRWGVTSDLTLSATANPDFSQVEADAGQLSFDPRSAVFFPEKRPFFLEGAEQFQTPNRLIYTRRVVDPVAAVKVAGKLSGTGIALLSAVDGEATSRTGDAHPWFNILRLQRDLGLRSKAALVYTDRRAGGDVNQVVGADARFGFGELWTLALQGAWSHTRRAGATLSDPLWEGVLSRNGRRFGLRWQATSLGEEFVTEAGFLGRPRITRVNLDHRLTFFGGEGSWLESVSCDAVLDGIWKSREFLERGPLERKLHLNNNAVLRGGWKVGLSSLIERFDYDADLYADYAVLGPGGAVLPFTGTPHINNLDWVVSANTPQFKGFSAGGFYLWGRDENFLEWSPADIAVADASLDWRPTDRVRLEARYQLQSYDRRSDGTNVRRRHLPRLKLEYQVSRSVFLRLVGELDADRGADLRDDTRSERPLLIRDAAGLYAPALAYSDRDLRVDFLFSYQPRPGTVLFLGYGSTLRDPRLEGGTLRRARDGFFAKLSWLFRM